MLSVSATAQTSFFFSCSSFHYVSCAAEDTDFCSLGAGLRGLPALYQEDVDGETHPKSGGPLALYEHGDRG